MTQGIIILGSANSQGDTFKHAHYLSQLTGFPMLDLKTKNILPFDYEFKNQEDDFLDTFKEIVDNYNLLIFATPVYWYSMSGIMKIFFDRISDCLKIHKDSGRKLRGKKMAVLSAGYDRELKPGFHMPFIESAKYLGMTYVGDTHLAEEKSDLENQNAIHEFAQRLQPDTQGATP